MRAVSDNQILQLRALIGTLRSALRSRLAVFRNREREEQLERDLEATRQAHIEQVTDLNRQIEAISAAYSEQAQQLERRISAVSESATESARQLQQKQEADYQILM